MNMMYTIIYPKGKHGWLGRKIEQALNESRRKQKETAKQAVQRPFFYCYSSNINGRIAIPKSKKVSQVYI
jgi:hypothetical protein